MSTCFICETKTIGYLPFCKTHYYEYKDHAEEEWFKALKYFQGYERRQFKKNMYVVSLEALEENMLKQEDRKIR